MQDLNLLIQVIQVFENKAKEMITILAHEFNLDLKSYQTFTRLIGRQNNLWKANLENNWTYCFHGDSCDFEQEEEE